MKDLRHGLTDLSFLILISVTLLSIGVCGQTKPKTSKFAGTYSYGKDVEKEPVGSILIYPETDNTILFYLDVCKGASQGYRLGQLYSRLKITSSGQGNFSEKYEWEQKGCKWTLQISGDKLEIKTVDSQDGCGFGYGVIADGTYLRTSKMIPEFFTDGHGNKIFFKDTKPETYLQ